MLPSTGSLTPSQPQWLTPRTKSYKLSSFEAAALEVVCDPTHWFTLWGFLHAANPVPSFRLSWLLTNPGMKPKTPSKVYRALYNPEHPSCGTATSTHPAQPTGFSLLLKGLTWSPSQAFVPASRSGWEELFWTFTLLALPPFSDNIITEASFDYTPFIPTSQPEICLLCFPGTLLVFFFSLQIPWFETIDCLV